MIAESIFNSKIRYAIAPSVRHRRTQNNPHKVKEQKKADIQSPARKYISVELEITFTTFNNISPSKEHMVWLSFS